MTPSSPGLAGRISGRAGYAITASVLAVVLFASGVPTALYDSYQAEWSFSPFVLTAVFATYGGTVLVALVGVGRISDIAGRRPTLLVALGMLLVAVGLFVAADGVGWLFAARALQGLSTGVAIAAAGAAMIDLQPSGDPVRAGQLNGTTSTSGIGIGVLVSALLVEHGPWPLRLPFLVVVVLVGLVLVGVLLMPESVTDRRRPQLRPAWPHVPSEIRGTFVFASLGMFASWAVGSVLLSLGPQIAATELGASNRVVASLAVVSMCATGAIAQLLAGRADPWRLNSNGAIVLAVGVAASIGSLALGSELAFVVAAGVVGIGWGMTYLGSLGTLTTVIPTAHRAAVMSAIFVVAYLSMSVPSLVAGVVATIWDVRPAFNVLGAVVIVAALGIAVITPVVRRRTAIPHSARMTVEPVVELPGPR